MADLSDADLDVLSQNLHSGKLDPNSLSAEKRANLKTQLTAYQARKTGSSPPVPKNTAGQNVYPQPKNGGGGPPPGVTDPVPDFAKGVSEGFHATPPTGEPTWNAQPSMPQRVGRVVGREGAPVVAGLAASGAAAAAGMGAIPAMAAVGVVGGGAEAYRQIFGTNPLLGEKGLTSEEATKLITVRALEQAFSEGVGRVTKAGINMVRGASLDQLRRVTGLPAQYVQRGMERPFTSLPKAGDSVVQAEKASMGHLENIQKSILDTREETGRAVNTALERLHVKMGGKKVVDTSPMAEAIRKSIGDMDHLQDPTREVLAREDREKITEILSTLETRDELPADSGARASTLRAGGTQSAGRYTDTGFDPLTGGARAPGPVGPNTLHPSGQASGGASSYAARSSTGDLNPGATSRKALKSIKDLVGIRRDVDDLVKYTDQGLPKGMKSGAGDRFMRTLAENLRGLISEVAEQNGKEGRELLMANSRHSNTVTNYDQWQKFLNTATDGDRDLLKRVQGIGNEVGKGGQSAGQLEGMKEAFPKAARAIDALHDSLARRALLQADEKPSSGWITALLRQVSGPKATAGQAVKAVRTGAGSSVPRTMQVGSSMSSAVINALLAHIQPEERKK